LSHFFPFHIGLVRDDDERHKTTMASHSMARHTAAPHDDDDVPGYGHGAGGLR
jgi:hypothetical protein